MKLRDYETYRAWYCGVCKQLHKSFGVASRFLLNYDLVLLAVLADGLSGEQPSMRYEGCFANPFARHSTAHNTSGLTLASDGLILLSYHQLRDNLADEKGLRRFWSRLAHPFLRRMYHRAETRCAGLSEVLAGQMGRQRQLEAAGCAVLDEACEPTGRMCEALFRQAGRNEEEKRILGRLGLFAGQIVYLLDAAEDYEEDLQRGRYNPFVAAGLSHTDAIAAAVRRCNMAAGEIALCYNLLPVVQHKEILDNIFFLGLPAGIAAAGVKRSKRRPVHGQIESL